MRRTIWIPMCILILFSCMIAAAQQSDPPKTGSEVTIPRLIKVSGTLRDSDGLPRFGTIEITFSLYASQQGGDPLWNESQVVQTDAQGSYSVYLGASEKEGLPLDLFSTEKARWLGVQVQGEEEQSRVLFVAVPYALKAADADTVGGKPLSSFVTYEDLAKFQETDVSAAKEASGSSSDASDNVTGKQGFSMLGSSKKKLASNGGATPVFATSGTAGRIAKFVNSTDLGDSVITESGGNVGIGTTNPTGSFTRLLQIYDATPGGNAALILSQPTKAYSFSLANKDFRIYDETAQTYRFVIDNNGNIGVGTTTPTASFTRFLEFHDVNPGGNAALVLSQPTKAFSFAVANTNFRIFDETAQAYRFAIDTTGNVGIGTISPGSKLTVAGDIESSTGFKINGSSVFNTTGTDNTFAGAAAGSSNTGSSNAFFGAGAGSANTTASANSFFGRLAGTSNTTGDSNSFFGAHSGAGNTTGHNNSFFGQGAGGVNTTGSFNSIFGEGAGKANTTADWNSFFGVLAGGSNNTGTNNSFFGGGAGSANTTGSSNSFLGRSAGSANTTGIENSFFGHGAGQANTTANRNSFFGRFAGNGNTTGGNNSFFGAYAGRVSTTAGDNSFFGNNAGEWNTGSFNSFFGSSAGFVNTTGASNSFFGQSAGRSNTTGNENSFFGQGAGQANTTAHKGSFFGRLTGNANTTGGNNSFFGTYAGLANTTAGDNSFFGNAAGQSNTTGAFNSFLGSFAGFANTTGASNSFFGQGAGSANTTGNENSFFGQEAGTANTSGSSNAFFGHSSGESNTTGEGNAFFGNSTGDSNTTGLYNSFFGIAAGISNTIGNRNTAIGAGAGLNATGDDNIYINNEGDAADSNTIRIGIVAPTTNYPNAHTQTFIGGIANATVTGSAVLITANGQLGIATSSRRFKEDIRDMGNASTGLFRLRPVAFRYKPEYSKEERPVQYGLIAEEVAEVYPELVQYDKDGKPFTVQYQVLSSMLLNEVQKQRKETQEQQAAMAEQKNALERKDEEINALNARVSALERMMERLTMQTTENREQK